jgi:DNA-binding transcriptional LysR family regulator
MVNFEWYRSFIAVYRAGTVSRAAQALYLTQPAVSQHLAALESALGISLFERTPRKMLPTEGGKRLYTQIADSVERLESIASKVSITDTLQQIRLGAPQEFFIERVLERLSPKENLEYVVRFGLPKDLLKSLREGDLDLVISTQKITHFDLDYQLLLEEKFWLVAPPDTKIPEVCSDLNQLEAWLRKQSWISYGEELPIIRRFWRQVFGRRIDTAPKLIIPDLRGIRQAVEYGLGFSVLPDYLCEHTVQEKRLTLILNPERAITNEIWLACRKSGQQAQRTQFLLELLRR